MSDERRHRAVREDVDAMFFVRAAAQALSDGGRLAHISSTRAGAAGRIVRSTGRANAR